MLSQSTGIHYFRKAFLFFGLSYVFRFGFAVFRATQIAFDFFISRNFAAPFFILPLGYFSTIGIFYLIFSSQWKRFKSKNIVFFGHGLAVILSVVSFLAHSHILLLALQCILLLVFIILTMTMHGEGRKLSKIKILYFLVALLWLINLLVIGVRGPFPFEIDLFFQLVSILVFVVIYYRLSKWLK